MPENNAAEFNGISGETDDDCMAPCEWMAMFRCHCESIASGEFCSDYIKANWINLFRQYDVNEKDCCLSMEEWDSLFTENSDVIMFEYFP